MPAAIPSAPTVGVIAQRLGVPLHKVEYIISSRDIRPVAMAGNARIFTESDVERIGSELRRIEADREGLQ